MREYQAPLADMQFVLRELVDRKLIAQLPGFEDVSLDPAEAVLEEVTCVHAVADTPARRPGASSARFPSRATFPIWQSGRGPRIDLLEAYTAFTCVTACTFALSPTRDTLDQRRQLLRYLHSCSGCIRLEHLLDGACTHWEAPPFNGARQKRKLEDSISVTKGGRLVSWQLKSRLGYLMHSQGLTRSVQ